MSQLALTLLLRRSTVAIGFTAPIRLTPEGLIQVDLSNFDDPSIESSGVEFYEL